MLAGAVKVSFLAGALCTPGVLLVTFFCGFAAEFLSLMRGMSLGPPMLDDRDAFRSLISSSSRKPASSSFFFDRLLLLFRAAFEGPVCADRDSSSDA